MKHQDNCVATLLEDNIRFVLDEKRYITDKLNPARSYRHDKFIEDEINLRETVLELRLADLVNDLIVERQPEQMDRLWYIRNR